MIMSRAHRILIFHPVRPSSINGGAQLRSLEVVRGFVELGCRVRLLHPGSPDGGFAELGEFGLNVDQHWVRLTRLDSLIGGMRTRLASRLTGRPRLGRSPFYSPRVRRWFASHIRGFEPDLVWMVYLHGHGITRLPGRGKPFMVIDALDLTTMHQAYYRAACDLFGPAALTDGVAAAANVRDEDLAEDYYDRRMSSPDPEECRLLNTYDAVVTISPIEAKVIAANVTRPSVTYLPLTSKVPAEDGPHDCGALAVMSFHPIILHCYLYLVRKVLPRVRQLIPGFRLRVVGGDSHRFPPAEGVDLVGFVPDIDRELAAARFLVAPLFGMTGQQTRIIYAMARGVPVVTLRKVAEAAGVRHGHNGMVADRADDFADHIVHLWTRPDECLRLSQGARQTIATDFSTGRLHEVLRSLLSRCTPSHRASPAPPPPGDGA